MGLDNFPHKLPCITQATAIFTSESEPEDPQVDCTTTQGCGGCPWKKDLGKMAGAIHGYLGSSCWYRGVVGNHLISKNLGISGSDINGYPYSLFGELDGQTYNPPDSCLRLADEIERVLTTQGLLSIEGFNSQNEAIAHVKYLVHWLRWVATKGIGAGACF
jgi:hypothetical protein